VTPAARRAAIGIALAGAAMLGLSMGLRQTLGLFLEPMTAAIGVSHSSFGLAIAVQNLLWGALTPAFGAVADRWGTGRVLVLGALLYVAGLVMMGLVQTPFGLHFGGGILIGIAVSATGFPLVLSAVARSVPVERRSAWMGLATAGGSIGQFALLPSAQGLIQVIGWAGALVGLGLLGLLMLPLARPLRGKPAVEVGGQRLGEAVTEARSHRGYLLLNAGFFVCGFHVAFIATHLPSYITNVGLSAFAAATALGVIGFFNVIGTFGAGWLGGRYRKKYLLSGIYVARALLVASLVVVPLDAITLYVIAAAIGLLWLGTVPLTSGVVGDIFGARYLATLFGFVMFSHQVGAFCGAWLGGLSYDLTGSYDAVWWLAAGLSLLSAAIHWPIADQPIRRPLREGAPA